METSETNMSEQTSAMPSNECPRYFRNCVVESRTVREGYTRAGFHLGIHLEQHVSASAIALLQEAVSGPDPIEQVWRWFGAVLPGCRAIVPIRRRRTFVRGLVSGAWRERIVLRATDDLLVEGLV